MERTQKITLIVCLFFISLIILFPPFTYTKFGFEQQTIVRYGFIFSDPPKATKYQSEYFSYGWIYNGVSFWRILAEIGVVVAGGGAVLLYLKLTNRSKEITLKTNAS